MNGLAVALVAICGGTAIYAYLGYPLVLWLLATLRPTRELPSDDPEEWPMVSVSLPAYNEEAVIGDTLDSLLALDYPSDRLQVIVISDASTDRTDEIVRTYADRGVRLLRLHERGGKTAAENAAVPHLEGSIVVSTDATIRVLPGSLKKLVRVFQDPSVGVASGRDRSVARVSRDPVSSESRYVSYEMWVRELETRAGTIVGASGCFYATRPELHQRLVPEELSRDFMSALHARKRGYRTVSVADAVALVPRARSLRAEFRRKARTMARGLDSLWFERGMLAPWRWGRFAWMLASHKLARWLVPLLAPLALAALAWLASQGSALAGSALAAVAVATLLTVAGLFWPEDRALPGIVSVSAYGVLGLAAGVAAWWKAFTRERQPVWEPTRRDGDGSPEASGVPPGE